MAGGTTTVIDCVMPGKDEPLKEAYNKWRGWAEEKVCCDYGLRVALPAVNEDTLKDMAELTSEEFGVNTFFMNMSGDQKLTDDELLRGFEACTKLGCLAQVHAESGEIIERYVCFPDKCHLFTLKKSLYRLLKKFLFLFFQERR